MSILLLLIKNLLLTVLLEGALVLIFTRNGKKVYHSALVNMLTNPVLNLFLILLASTSVPIIPWYYVAMLILEILAFAAEGLLYYKMGDFGIKKSFLASFLLNLASFSFGFLL